MARSKYTNNRYKQKGKRYNRFRRKPMIPKTLRFKTDEYHTTFLTTENWNISQEMWNDASVFKAYGTTFQLPDLTGIANWQRLFEEFRINKVVVSFIPVQAQMKNRTVAVAVPVGAVSASTQIPFCYYVIDRNDVSLLAATVADFKERKGVVRKLATEPHVISFTPSILNAVYAGPAVPPDTTPQLNYNINYRKNWCQNNLAQAGINQPYWGIKYGIEPATPEGAFRMKVSAKYYVSFRKKIS